MHFWMPQAPGAISYDWLRSSKSSRRASR